MRTTRTLWGCKGRKLEELCLPTAAKDNKKCFYKYINNKRRAKENLHPLLDAGRRVVTKDKEKVEVLNAFFTSVFNSKTSCSPGTQLPEQEGRDREQNEAEWTISEGKWLVTCYTT